jgi:hypothetical protein
MAEARRRSRHYDEASVPPNERNLWMSRTTIIYRMVAGGTPGLEVTDEFRRR